MSETNPTGPKARTETDASHHKKSLASAVDALELVEDRRTSDDETYAVADCGSVTGSLTGIHVTADMNDGPLEVSGVRADDDWSGVELRWTSGPVEVGTSLDPADARDLAARLLAAADTAEGKEDA